MFPGFSESQFEFLVTHELTNLWRHYLIDPAHMTTNWEEAQLGYDVRLDQPGVVVLSQFKLSEHLVGANSKEFRSGFRRLPYYRVKIANSAPSCQYDKLRHTVVQTISRAGKGVVAVYVAPKFMDGAQGSVPRSKVRAHSQAWLGGHFKNTTLLQHLLVQDLLGLTGITAGQDHALAICATSGVCAICSEPEFIEGPFDIGEFVPEGFAGTARNRLEVVELRALLEAAREARPRLSSFSRLEDVRDLSDVELLRAVRSLMDRDHRA